MLTSDCVDWSGLYGNASPEPGAVTTALPAAVVGFVKYVTERAGTRSTSVVDTLEFHGPHGSLQIFSILVDGSQSKPAAQGFQHLRYSVGGHGFSGAADSFVSEAELRVFCASLIELATGADVEARLAGHDVRGFTLCLKPGPEADRVSVEGRIVSNAYRTLKEEDGLYIWATQFGFWVERHTLASARRVRWVRHYTGI